MHLVDIRNHCLGEKTQLAFGIKSKNLENVNVLGVDGVELKIGHETWVTLPKKIEHAGVYKLGKIKVSHLGVRGLFRPWLYVVIKRPFYVYPKGKNHLGDANGLDKTTMAEKVNLLSRNQGMEYDSQSKVTILTPLAKVNWKKSVAGTGVYWIKNYFSPSQNSTIILADEMPLTDEAKAEQIAYWVEKIEQAGEVPIMIKGIQRIVGKNNILRCITEDFYGIKGLEYA